MTVAASEGMTVGLLFKGLGREDVEAGDVITGGAGDGDDLGEAARRMGLGG